MRIMGCPMTPRRRWRLLAVISAVVAIMGCARQGDPQAPFVDSRPPPRLPERFMPPHGWTWGLIQPPQSPPLRYGVAAPATATRAQIIILPGYDDTAEGWFETARAMTAAGYGVWILEPLGQGGSGRLTLPRDLAHVTSFDPTVVAVRSLASRLVPHVPGTPTLLLGEGSGAILALLAADPQTGIDGLILSAPDLRAPVIPPHPWAWPGSDPSRWRSPGRQGWSRQSHEALDPQRDLERWSNQQDWMLANPDLRMGGPSLGWLKAKAQAIMKARTRFDARLPAMVVLGPADQQACQNQSFCETSLADMTTRQPHLAIEALRQAWQTRLIAFVEARIAAQRTHAS